MLQFSIYYFLTVLDTGITFVRNFLFLLLILMNLKLSLAVLNIFIYSTDVSIIERPRNTVFMTRFYKKKQK